MRLSDLQSKKIINIITGSNVGTIVDVDIRNDGTIDSLLIEQNKNFFSLSREEEIRIFWKEISKIGEDVILIKKE